MKLRNIFLLISCCFAVLSCSMEEDTIMSDVEKNIDNIKEDATEMYTSINWRLTAEEMLTKSTITDGGTESPNYDPDHSTTNEKFIDSFDIFVLDENGKIIHIISKSGQVSGEGGEKEDITLKDTRFITKYREGRRLKAYAIVNAQGYSGDEKNGKNLFADVKIGDGINKVLSKEISGHLTANTLVKVGFLDITMNNKDFHYQASMKNFPEEKDYVAKIPVRHIAARLDFSKFSYTFNGFTRAPKVTLLEAKFENIQSKGGLNGNETGFVKGTDVALAKAIIVRWDDSERKYMLNPSLRGYSYRNQSEQTLVTLYIKVCVEDTGVKKEYERRYIVNPEKENKSVNHDYVMGGYLYDIEVNWTITPTWADSSIKFYTEDWKYVQLDDIEI